MTQARSPDLLIAPPAIPDNRFKNTVIMLTHDHGGGSFALCLNRPTDHTLQDILTDTGIDCDLNFPLYWGGPVSPGTVWMLHSSEWDSEHTIPVSGDWSMTSNLEMFNQLAQGNCPLHFRLTFGYCSWAPNQLQRELDGMAPWKRQHSWLVAHNPGPEWVMEQPVEDMWANATTLCGHQAVDSWL